VSPALTSTVGGREEAPADVKSYPSTSAWVMAPLRTAFTSPSKQGALVRPTAGERQHADALTLARPPDPALPGVGYSPALRVVVLRYTQSYAGSLGFQAGNDFE